LALDVGGLDGVRAVLDRCAAEGVNAGYALGVDFPEHPDGLLVAITEQRSRADIDRLVDVLGRAVQAQRAGAPVAEGART
jgi:glycine dehydrogenase subunit 1